MKNFNSNGGFIRLILIIIILLIVLGFFGVDIENIVESELVQKNLNYVFGFAITIWSDYLMDPITYFWQNIFIDLLWSSFVSNMERIKAGEPHDFIRNAPSVDFSVN